MTASVSNAHRSDNEAKVKERSEPQMDQMVSFSHRTNTSSLLPPPLAETVSASLKASINQALRSLGLRVVLKVLLFLPRMLNVIKSGQFPEIPSISVNQHLPHPAFTGDLPGAENSGASHLGPLSLLLAALFHFLISSSLLPTVLLLPEW